MLTIGPSEIILCSARGVRSDIRLSYYFRLTQRLSEQQHTQFSRLLKLRITPMIPANILSLHFDFASDLPEFMHGLFRD